MNEINDDKQVRKLKSKVIIAASQAGEGHIPSAFSILDIDFANHALFL